MPSEMALAPSVTIRSLACKPLRISVTLLDDLPKTTMVFFGDGRIAFYGCCRVHK